MLPEVPAHQPMGAPGLAVWAGGAVFGDCQLPIFCLALAKPYFTEFVGKSLNPFSAPFR